MATLRGGLVSDRSTPSVCTQTSQLINYLVTLYFRAGTGLVIFVIPSACTKTSQLINYVFIVYLGAGPGLVIFVIPVIRLCGSKKYQKHHFQPAPDSDKNDRNDKPQAGSKIKK